MNKDVIVEMLQENRKKLLGPATKYKIPPSYKQINSKLLTAQPDTRHGENTFVFESI